VDLAGDPNSSKRASTLSNPESYAYFALAAYYYKNKGVYFRGGDVIILKNSLVVREFFYIEDIWGLEK
jgi:hypothetical protein